MKKTKSMKKIILLTSIGLSVTAIAQIKKLDTTRSKENQMFLDLTKEKKQKSLATPYLNESNIRFYKNLDSAKASLYKMNVKKIANLPYSSIKNRKQSNVLIAPIQSFPLQKPKDTLK